MYAAFLDEMQKIAASRGRMRIPQSRKGRRPMSVTTLLRKEKDGSLYKDAAPVASLYALNASGPSPATDRPATAKRRPGDVPTLDDPAAYPKADQTHRASSALSPALDAVRY